MALTGRVTNLLVGKCCVLEDANHSVYSYHILLVLLPNLWYLCIGDTPCARPHWHPSVQQGVVEIYPNHAFSTRCCEVENESLAFVPMLHGFDRFLRRVAGGCQCGRAHGVSRIREYIINIKGGVDSTI
eukprot:1288764-Pyramimonas_sp.AAC.2